MAAELATVDRRAARPRGHGLPRAADAAGGAHRRAREPRRRRPPGRPGAPRRRGRARPNASAPWSATCSSLSRVEAGVAPLRLGAGAGRRPGRRGRGRPRAHRPGRAVRRRHPRVARGARRPRPAAPAAHQRARQRRPAQPRGRAGARHLRRSPPTGGGSTSPTRAGRRTRRPRARLRAVRHAGRPRRARHRRDRPRASPSRAGSRPSTAARSGSPTRRPAASGALLRVDLPLSPPARPSAPTHQEAPMPTTPTPPPPPPPAADLPRPPRRRRSRPRRSSTRCSAGSGPTCRAGAAPLVLAAAGVGVLAGLVLPNHTAGLALFLVVRVGRAHGGVRRPAQARPVHPDLPGPRGALHAAGRCCSTRAWIGVLCLLAGATALIAGVTRVHRVPEFVLAGLAWPLAGLRDLPWLGRSLRGLTGHGTGAAGPASPSLWSVLAVLVFGLLFVSRRRHRGELGRRRAARHQRRLGRAARLHRRRGRRPDPRRGVPRPEPAPRPTPTASCLARPCGHRFEWLVPVLLVDAVFAVFVAAQLSVFFGGHDYVQRTTGLTYADYVHQGFGQLTVATAAHPARRVGRARTGPATSSRTGVWLRASLGAPVRPDPGRGRLGAVPDAPLPGGLRLHPAPAAGRRVRGLARPRSCSRWPSPVWCAGASGCRGSR